MRHQIIWMPVLSLSTVLCERRRELKWRARLLNAAAGQSGARKRSAGRARLRRAATRSISIAKFLPGKIRAGLPLRSSDPQSGASAERRALISRPCQCSIFISTAAAKISVPANSAFSREPRTNCGNSLGARDGSKRIRPAMFRAKQANQILVSHMGNVLTGFLRSTIALKKLHRLS